jgi:hypothetical protein
VVAVAGSLFNVRYGPIATKLPLPSEMTRWAMVDIKEHAGDVSAINLGIFMIASNYQYVYERQ